MREKKHKLLRRYDLLPAHRARSFRRLVLSIIQDEFEDRFWETVTDWAVENRVLPLTSPERGGYNPDRLAYQAGIQDTFTLVGVREITVMGAERTGKSTVLSNILGFIIDRRPAAVLWVLPNLQAMMDFVRDEIRPMISASKRLRKRIASRRGGKRGPGSIRRIEFENGQATFVGGGSSTNLAVKGVKYVISDETDKLKNLPSEGDADALLAKRIAMHEELGGMVLRFSKPTTPDRSRVYRHFLRGSQGRYFSVCPSCGTYQNLRWGHIRPEDARGRCDACKGYFTQEEWLGQAGEWRHTVDENRSHRSFQLSVLINPFVKWATLVEEFKAAQDAAEQGDLSLLQVFENSRLGEVSGVYGATKIDVQDLYDRRHPFGEADIPEGVVGITLGIDTQADGFKWLVCGWGRQNEVWLLETGTISGDMRSVGPWRELQELLVRFWYDQDGNLYRSRGACLDVQGAHYDACVMFVRKNGWRRLVGVRGLGADKRRSSEHTAAIIRNAYKDAATKTTLQNIDVDAAKSVLMVMLERSEPSGPGIIHIPCGPAGEEVRGFDLETIAEFTAEHRRKRMDRGYVVYSWHKEPDRPNHRLDCLVYAYAAKILTKIDFDKAAPIRVKKENVEGYKAEKEAKLKADMTEPLPVGNDPNAPPPRPGGRQRPRTHAWRGNL